MNAELFKKSALIVMSSGHASQVWQTLRDAGWTFAAISSVAELKEQSADAVDCMVLDDGCQPLVSEVLAWCELTPEWRVVPKLLLVPPASSYNSLQHVPVEELHKHIEMQPKSPRSSILDILPPRPAAEPVPEGLRRGDSKSITAQETDAVQDRRQFFRYRCQETVLYRSKGKMLDLSLGGLALEVPCALAPKTVLEVCISEQDPLLRLIEAEVLRCRWQHDDVFLVNMRFCKVTPQIERALHRWMITRQGRFSGLRTGVLPSVQ